MMEEEFFNQEFENTGAVIPLIHKLEDEEPDKRTKDWKIWKDKINFLYLQYNKLATFKAFKTL